MSIPTPTEFDVEAQSATSSDRTEHATRERAKVFDGQTRSF